MDKGFGSVTFKGKKYVLTQDAWVDGVQGRESYYKAAAEDAEGNEYMVYWNITHPDFNNLEDESEACDWDNPIDVAKI